MNNINFFFNGSGEAYPGQDLIAESHKYFYWEHNGDVSPFVKKASKAVDLWFSRIRSRGRFQYEWDDHMERVHHTKWFYMYHQFKQEHVFRSPVVINDGDVSAGLGRIFVSHHLLPDTIKPMIYVSKERLYRERLIPIKDCDHLQQLFLNHTAWKDLYQPGLEWVICVDQEHHHIFDIDCEKPDENGAFCFDWFHRNSPEKLYRTVHQRIIDLADGYDATEELKQMILDYQVCTDSPGDF